MRSHFRSLPDAVIGIALCLSAYGCGDPGSDWSDCLGEPAKALEGYQKIYALAKTKVAELPPPGTDPTAIANRKILDDALLLAGGEITTLDTAINGIRTTVEAALKGTNAAAAVVDGCAKLEAAGKQASEKLATTTKAIQLYVQMTTSH